MNTSSLLIKTKKIKQCIPLITHTFSCILKNKQKYLAYCKSKSEVRGGGRKPWKQKGTGRARAGSSRSPLWIGGGKIFGPKLRENKNKINKKTQKLLIYFILLFKLFNFSYINYFSNFNYNYSTLYKIYKNKYLFHKYRNKFYFIQKFYINKFLQIKKKVLILVHTNNQLKHLYKLLKNNTNIAISLDYNVNLNILLKSTLIFYFF